MRTRGKQNKRKKPTNKQTINKQTIKLEIDDAIRLNDKMLCLPISNTFFYHNVTVEHYEYLRFTHL